MSQKVFISYRRETASWPAKQIRRALIDVLPADDVFMDIDSIPIGKNFETTLKEWVAQCGTMLAIIDDKWLTVVDKKGNRRLDSKTDYVRIEIAAGLARGIRVVPVLLDGASMPAAEDLPTGLKGLRKRQAVRIDLHTDDTDIASMLIKLGLVPAAEADRKPAPPPATASQDAKPASAIDVAPKPFTSATVSFSITPPAATQPAPGAIVPPAPTAQPQPAPQPSPPAPVHAAPVTPVALTRGWSYDREGSGGLATTVAVIVALSTPVAMITGVNAFESYGIDALSLDPSFAYLGARATGSVVAALPYLAVFIVSLVRNRPGVAAAFYWIAAAMALVVACINIAMARFWGSPGQYYVSDYLDLAMGAWVGFGLAAFVALALTVRQRRLTPASVAVLWVGLAGAGGIVLATGTKAWDWAWIMTPTGDGSIAAGILLGVTAALFSGAMIVLTRRAPLRAGELFVWLGGGLVAATFFAVPVYMILFPGSAVASSTTYGWAAFAASALLFLGWCIVLGAARRRRSA
ncbi:MAG: TIR domain-containing protein [Rhizobiaceae bacterium]|nr:TIR domain-containing protein [Rhizobiaceae bacterium]